MNNVNMFILIISLSLKIGKCWLEYPTLDCRILKILELPRFEVGNTVFATYLKLSGANRIILMSRVPKLATLSVFSFPLSQNSNAR
jgi:hypothetical protein